MEVCVDSIQSAINAEKGGASRIELCSALSEGGLTPSSGMLKVVKSCLSIPVYVMLRPRKGMDFVYSEKEISSMKYDALQLRELGADGFVFGVLNSDATVNTEVCKDLLNIVSPLPVTFHRAFDVVCNPFDTLFHLIQLGFTRVLTSGQACSAVDGIPLIQQLVEISNNRIIIMPGAGINANNVRKILVETSVREIHASCKNKLKYEFPAHKRICALGLNDTDNDLLVTDSEIVQELVSILKSCNDKCS